MRLVLLETRSSDEFPGIVTHTSDADCALLQRSIASIESKFLVRRCPGHSPELAVSHWCVITLVMILVAEHMAAYLAADSRRY